MRAVLAGWNELLEANLRAAQRQGDLAQDADIGQLTFEINALLHEANGHYLLFRDPAALDRRANGDRRPTRTRDGRERPSSRDHVGPGAIGAVVIGALEDSHGSEI